MQDSASIDDLLAIMTKPRDPVSGCPWDLKQSFRTILPYTLEEAYEVAAAIEQDDMDALCDELGNLLFSCVNLARHLGFDAEQALRAANHRFERRFGRVEQGLREQRRKPGSEAREEMERLWEIAKTEEKG